MRVSPTFKALLVVAIALPFLSSFVFAQTSDPAWLDTLNFEMERDHECEVAYYIRIKEGTLGAEKTYEARLQCVDGRQFDATRIGEMVDFEVKACEIQAC
jgi:hypothetical protein